VKADLTPLTEWWFGRSSRERLLLAVMLALLAVVVIWYGAVQPLRQGAAAAAEARAAAAASLARAEAMAARIQALQARSGATRTPEAFETLVADTAAKAGVVLDRRQRDGAVLTVWTDSGDPKTYFGWLSRLQHDNGVSVTSFTAIPGPGGRMQMQAALTD
jgi:general secretion pathway protein M